MRTASLNAQYLILFKSPRAKTVLQHLGNQMYPKNSKVLFDAFADATQEPYGYLVLDLRQDTPENMRICSHIFANEQEVVYLPVVGYINRAFKAS